MKKDKFTLEMFAEKQLTQTEKRNVIGCERTPPPERQAINPDGTIYTSNGNNGNNGNNGPNGNENSSTIINP